MHLSQPNDQLLIKIIAQIINNEKIGSFSQKMKKYFSSEQQQNAKVASCLLLDFGGLGSESSCISLRCLTKQNKRFFTVFVNNFLALTLVFVTDNAGTLGQLINNIKWDGHRTRHAFSKTPRKIDLSLCEMFFILLISLKIFKISLLVLSIVFTNAYFCIFVPEFGGNQ